MASVGSGYPAIGHCHRILVLFGLVVIGVAACGTTVIGVAAVMIVMIAGVEGHVRHAAGCVGRKGLMVLLSTEWFVKVYGE